MSEDEALVAAFLGGDAATIATVRGWVRGGLSGFRASLSADLEDLEQEVLLDLTRDLRQGRFRGDSRFATYVRTYVAHKGIDRLRAARRREWVDVGELELASPEPSAFERLASAEETALALKVLGEISEDCRSLWSMIQEGLPYREMAERTGVAEGTLRVRVLRCRQRALAIRERLRRD